MNHEEKLGLILGDFVADTVIITADDTFDGVDTIRASLQPRKLVLCCLKKDLAAVLRKRNEFAVEHGMPVEVFNFGKPSVHQLCKVLKSFNASVCLGSGDTCLNNTMVAAAYLTGKETHYLANGSITRLPVWSVPLNRLLSPKMIKILRTVQKFEPISISALSKVNGFGKEKVAGRIRPALEAGLVQETNGSEYSLTELGRLVVNT